MAGVRGAEHPTEMMIQVKTELKAEMAVAAAVAVPVEVVPQVGTLAVDQVGILVAEAPPGMGRPMVQIRCWPFFAP